MIRERISSVYLVTGFINLLIGVISLIRKKGDIVALRVLSLVFHIKIPKILRN